jgi:hypothetical protein
MPFQPSPFRYTPEKNPTLELIGLILWATEGDKTQISLANGNPHIIQRYLEFLRMICNVDEERIKGVIHCHDTLPYDHCLHYWSAVSEIPPKRFTKPFIKKDKGGTRKYPYGIMRIASNNKGLVRIFNERLREIRLPRN